MKKIHIALLVLIAVTIAVLISFMGTLSTYDSVQSAMKKKGKTVSIIAKLDRTRPIEYDARKKSKLFEFCSLRLPWGQYESGLPKRKADKFRA
jgi:cytochrome c-type biogenesis protein CcmE